MSIDPALLRALQAAGGTMDMVIAMVEADHALEEEKRARKRAGNAARQRRFKAKQAENNADNALPALDDVTERDRPPLDEREKSKPPRVPTGRVIPPRAREKFPAPEGVTDAQWKGFLQLRIAKRQPMTERGYTLLCGKLTGLAEHGFPPGEMIDFAIERGWTTVHEPHDQQGPRNGHSRQPASRQSDNLRGSRPDPCVDILRQATAELRDEAASRYQGAGGEARTALPAVGTG